jgi:arylsulfatase A-like enzyme
MAPPGSSKLANLLWLMSDSFDGRFLDPTAPQWHQVGLPNLRALASQGTNFVRTYANSPQCVPSRCSMMMGRMTHHIGAYSNSMGLAYRYDPSFVAPKDSCRLAFNVSLCEAMQDNAAAGAPQQQKEYVDKQCKVAWNQSICHHMVEQWQPNVSHSTPDVLRALRDRGGVDVRVFGKVDIGFGFLEEFPNATASGFHGGPTMSVQTRSADIHGPTKPDPRSITSTDDDHVHPEDWHMVDRCVEWLRSHDPQKRGWLLHCSVNIPHPPFDTNATWLSRVNDSAIGVPPSFRLSVDQMHPADAYVSISKNVAGNFSDAEVRRTRRVYAAMCAETDYLLGRVLDAARSSGHWDDSTYVIFLSDHGEMAMEHRQVWKNSMYEASSRVPLMIAGPGVAAGRTETGLASLLDVYPTILDVFGVDHIVAGVALDGASLLGGSAAEGSATDRAAPPATRQFVVSEYHSNMLNTGTFMLRHRNGYKLVAFGTSPRGLERAADYKPQLFHVESDPEEMHDLAPESESAHLVAELDALLRSVVDYEAVDDFAKSIDHWLYQQWYLLAGHRGGKPSLEAVWRDAYGDNFTAHAWTGEWEKAERWTAAGSGATA